MNLLPALSVQCMELLPEKVLRDYSVMWPEKFVSLPVEDESEEVSIVYTDRRYTCYECYDTLVVQDYYYDTDSHIMMPDGTKPCVCTL